MSRIVESLYGKYNLEEENEEDWEVDFIDERTDKSNTLIIKASSADDAEEKAFKKMGNRILRIISIYKLD